MKSFQSISIAILTSVVVLMSCKNEDKKKEADMTEPKLKEENVIYEDDGFSMNGFVVYDENIKGVRPAVFVIHEWWGLNDYTKMRARELAKLGYIAMAIDLYGGGKQADNPATAQELATPFYENNSKCITRFVAAENMLKKYPQMDSTKVAAIGYCFGGTQVLNLALYGLPLKVVVSFHGGLDTYPASLGLTTAKILVCHGEADSFVPDSQVAQFKAMMDSAKIPYQFKSYKDATHAFTNPDATAKGEKFKLPIKYNAAADTASWNDMKDFFEKTLK